MNCIVLYYSIGTVNCEYFHYELHCLVRACVRLQPVGLKRQTGGVSPGVMHTWHLGSCMGLGTHNEYATLGLLP